MTTNSGIITVQGTTLFVASALPGGSAPTITSLQITSDLLACTGSEQDLGPNVVLTLPAEDLSFAVPSPGVLRVGVSMDTTVGDFTIGTLGVFSEETLVALAAFPGAGQKLAANPPVSGGNTRSLYVDLVYQAIGGQTQAPAVNIDTDVLVQTIIFGG